MEYGIMRADFYCVLTDMGQSGYLRRKSVTLDTAHGSPQSESAPSDTAITIVTFPLSFKELKFVESGLITEGDLVGYLNYNVDVREDDLIIIKNENQTGDTTIAGTSATQAVISGDVRNKYSTYDYISISDSDNDLLYKITGVSYSTNTTLTIAFTANPSTGDTLYTSSVFKVVKVTDMPNDENIVYRKLLLRKLS